MIPPVIVAVDEYANPKPGVELTFEVTGGGGVTPASVTTDFARPRERRLVDPGQRRRHRHAHRARPGGFAHLSDDARRRAVRCVEYRVGIPIHVRALAG